MVYLPMCYLYGKRFVYDDAATDPTVMSLRSELYTADYDTIHWTKVKFIQGYVTSSYKDLVARHV